MHPTDGADSVKLLLELSMECEPLARAEAMMAASATGSGAKSVLEAPGVIVMDTDADPHVLARRLGLCHRVDQWICTCAAEDVETCAREIDIEGPISVRSTEVGEHTVNLLDTSRRVGAVVGRRRGVDLSSPRSELRLVFSGGRAHIGRALATVDRPALEKRKNRYLPYSRPVSLHPKLARALVNLTGVRAGGRLLDPFCGTGAILSEASMIGLKAIGSDFSERMIEGCGRNIAHLGQTAELHLCDVGAIAGEVGPVDGIATDPPYGRSTSTDGEDLQGLYGRAFDAFRQVLVRASRVAVVVPDLDLVGVPTGFRLTGTYPLWVHRSLTRNFCLLERT